MCIERRQGTSVRSLACLSGHVRRRGRLLICLSGHVRRRDGRTPGAPMDAAGDTEDLDYVVT